MMRILSVFFFLIYCNFNNYCGCCGTCSVDPKLEMERQYKDMKIEDSDILNKDDGYTLDDYSELGSIADVELSEKEPKVTSKLNFNSIIKASKYFLVFFNAYFSIFKNENFNEMFEEGFKGFINKLVKDINDKSDFNFDQINDYFVFETSFSLNETKYSQFKEKLLSNTNNRDKLYNIIYPAIEKKNEFYVYFNQNLGLIAINPNYLRKKINKADNEYIIVYNSLNDLDTQEITKLESIDDLKDINFTFIFFLQSREFLILLSKEQYDVMIDEYNKQNPPPPPPPAP